MAIVKGFEETEDFVRRMIVLYTKARTEPVLSENEIEQLVGMAKRTDANGLTPDEANWTPTWSCNQAIAMGWELKAASVATGVDFVSGKQQLKRSQMFSQLMAMSDRWKRRVAETLRVPSSTTRTIAGINTASDECWDFDRGLAYGSNHGYIPGIGQWIDDL